MKQFRPIAAMLAAIALFAFYLLDVDRVERGVLEDLQNQQVLFNDPSRAVALEFSNEDGVVRLERDSVGDSWQIVEPQQGNADGRVINAYLENLRGARRQARFPAEDLTKYGLDSPKRIVRISFNTDQGIDSYHILFGSQPTRFGNVYTMVKGEDEVFTVSEWFYRQSGKSLEDIRDRSIVHVNPSTVTDYRIETRRSQFALHRESNTSMEWMVDMEGEQPIPADRTIVERLQMSLSQGTFLEVYDDPTTSSEELGFADPALRLALNDEDTVVLGRPIPGREQFYARGSEGRIGVVSAGLFADFFRQPLEWGTKRFVWMPVASIQEIRSSSGTSRMHLKKTPDGWKFAEMEGLPVRQDSVEQLLSALADFRAVSLVEAELSEEEMTEYGLLDESYRLIVSGENGRSQGFRFGRTDTREGVTYTLREQDGSLWLINFQVQSGVYKVRSDLVENRLVPSLIDEAQKFVIETDDGNVSGKKESSAWRISLPNSPPAFLPKAQMTPLLAAFQDLEVESEMYTSAHLPPLFTITFYGESEEVPLFKGSLVERKDTAAYFRIDGRRVEVSARQFAKFDSELARLLLMAKAKLDEAQN